MKTILLLALTVSLYANSIMCDYSKSQYLKDEKYLKYAVDRGNINELQMLTDTVLISLESMMIECTLTDKQQKRADSKRKALLNIRKSFKAK